MMHSSSSYWQRFATTQAAQACHATPNGDCYNGNLCFDRTHDRVSLTFVSSSGASVTFRNAQASSNVHPRTSGSTTLKRLRASMLPCLHIGGASRSCSFKTSPRRVENQFPTRWFSIFRNRKRVFCVQKWNRKRVFPQIFGTGNGCFRTFSELETGVWFFLILF